MDDYFNRELRQINREITRLKTSGQKSGGIVPTVATTINVTEQLQLIGLSTAYAEAYYKIRTNSTALVMTSLDKYYDDIFNIFNHGTRSYDCYLHRRSNGDIIMIVYFSGNQDDARTLWEGGSVSMSTEVTVRCTDNFTIERI